ncbi:hypothetical protein QYE76_040614 [Lolium multiflorum]|uniref:Gag-pol polyprotein n=1 Tax=Lolium multiflorum TaxID=4521 RepID=A0AAD8TDP0_LOLMU|nr:hypothetical protein QYE76_040614 [Lolium multiflorum]
MAWPRHPVVWGPHSPFRLLRVLLRPENLSHREDLTKGYSRLCAPERKELSGGQESAGKFPPGEIDAIAIVIERDIISIIIIIAHHLGISMNEVRKKLFTISLSGKAAHWYKLLKNGDSIDWEDIVPLFYSKFYPPNKTLLDTSCSGSFTRKNEEFKRDLLDRIQENTEGWENDKDRESGIIYDYKCIEAFMDTDKFRNMSATYGLDSQVVANLYKAFASHYELPKKNFDKYHEPYKDKVDSSVNKCVVIETVDNVIPEAYIEKTPFPAKMKEYSVISSAVNKSEKKPKEPEEQIKIEPAVAIVKDLVTENVEDGHIIFCEDASNIVSHPNKSKQVSVPMLSVRIGDHCYYEKLFLQLVLFEMWKFYVQHLENSESEAFRKERDELEEIFLRQPILKHDLPVEDLGTTPPPKEDPVFDLKPLPDNLKYAHIDDKKIYPVIISSKLSEIEEERLLEILKKHRGAIGYTLDDLKGISPSICQHAINMEEDAKPVVEHQRRLIPKMKEVVRNEVLKLLEAGIIYPIADSRWVSPVHCVPKKGGMTVVPNDNDELIPQRIVVDMASPINFNQFLEKEKLKSNGSNFTDWFRHVRIFLNGGNLQYVLDAPLGDPPAETETDEVKNVYATRKTRYSQVQCAILCSLESDLQKRFEHHDPHELMKELKTIFETHAAVECYEASKHFFSCMMEEGSSISEHMLVMTGHAKKLSDLGIVIPNRLGINRVLQSLPPSYKNFVMNYNMQNMNKEFPELFGMLKAAEIEIKKEHQVLMVNKTTSFKKQGKSKGKFKKGGKKAATPPMKPKNGPKPDADCYYCKEKGHWKRNCSKYLADLKSGLVKKKKEGISDIHVIDVHFTGSRSSTWVFDTGSVAHICNSKQELKNKRQLLKDEVTMRVGNGSKVNVIAVGTLPLHLPSGLVLSLNNCYYVPALSMNIISGSCLMQDGYSFKSENNGCSIFMNNIFYGRAPEKNGLFLLDLDSSDTHIHNIDAKRIKLNDNSTYMWHCRLGHIGVKRMKKLHTDGLLESLDFESLDRCEACLMGKMTKTPFSGMMERATDLLEIIHTDVCGPMSVASRGGYRYVLTFTDDLSRYGYIYLMKHKSETFEKFKEFQSEVENQRNKKIKFLRSDRGGEYLSYEFGMHLKKCGILSQLTPPGTPQRNGVSERRNRTLLDMVRSMMSLTDLPLSFWSYALETAAFTLNRAPSKSVETTPYELWFNKKPKLSFLKVWGCEAYVKKLQPDKLEPKAEKCVFIGYPKETIGYTFYHRSEGKIFVAKNGTFLEKEFLTKEVTGRKVELDEIEESLLVDQSSAVPENVPVPPTPTTEEANDNDHETSYETATEPRRSTRDRATPDWYDPCLNVMIVDNNDEDPATYEEAMMSPDSNKWQEAMKSEMGSMYDNKVWTLVDLPDSRKAVENKWIFKRKTDADGNITVYKARLVAKGFRQIQGVDYDETFSPVAKLKSVRILLAIAAFFDYEIWQMDVKTAFLNGDIEEELYMVQPKGFVDPKNADKVCKLQRSIYGLKQASRSWNRRFDKVIKDFGFIQCHGEACIYKKVSGSSVAFLILYVDDILLIGNDIELLSSVKGYLNNSFSMKDLGEASYILGIKIYRDRSRRLIGLSQSTYLDKILKKFRMDESKKGFLPMLPGKVLSKTQGPATAEERERMSQIPYASAVGSIMYAMLCTRPDIAHAVSLTSRYQSDPGMEHWTAVKNILKYLKRTKDMFLCYGGDQELVVTSYTDASWNTDPDDSKSQSGYVFILNGAAVSWASSKQCTVAKSSTESEYIAASEASSEAVWMKRFIVELGVVPSALDPFVIYCDNMGAIANAQEPRSHKRLKHIKLRYHSIREYIEDGEVKICKVHTDLNVADPLTKALPRAKHDQHQNAMGVSTMVSNNKDKGPLKENIQDPELKEEDAREDEEEVEEAPQEHQRATVASIGVISNPSNIKRSARIATGGAVPRHYLAPRTSSPSNYNPYRNLIYDRQTERTPKVVLPSNWDIDRSDIAGEMKSEAEGWGNNSKSWNSPPDMIMSRVEHNSEMIRNLTYEIEDLKELVKKLVERNPSPSSPKE